MATKTTTRYVDDLDGSEGAETVRFGLDGKQYEIDLSEENAGRLREILAPYTAVGRKVPARGSTALPRPTLRDRREEATLIRAWAVANGHQVANRGRIPEEIRIRYNKAHAA